MCLAAAAAVAGPVGQAKALRVANNFWQTVLHCQGEVQPMAWQFDEVYLFVNENGGFVMVSANDCARPIIAYSRHNTMDPEALPLQLRHRMKDYCAAIAAAAHARIDSHAAAWEGLLKPSPRKDADSTDRVDPLVQTQWHQDGGYALFTPNHTPTGCAATAQAQLMRFWNYPAFGRGNESYSCPPYGAQTADFAHTLYDWANMPARVTLTSPEEEQVAVSTLMYHLGVSLHMAYAPGGSAAAGLSGQPGYYSIDNSLKDYFYYNPGMRAIFKTNGYTDQRWADSLKAELRLHHPIVYCGVAPEGGHGFICDGYEYRDGQIFFHFNFGWAGKSDGYYTVDDICPNISPTGEEGGVYHFNESNQALLGAVPDYRLHVSDTLVAFTREGGSNSILFSSIDTSSLPWRASSPSPWVHINTGDVAHAGAITITADANTSGSERMATVHFVQGSDSIAVKVVQTYYSADEYCPLTVVMESTRGGGWEGGAYLSFESPSGYVYNTATLATGSSQTVSVGVAPHDVNVVFHRGGGTDRYINYRVTNQYGEELVNVQYAYMNGGTHFIEWPCVHVGIDEAENSREAATLWPNPTTGILNIEADGPTRIDILDACGHTLLSGTAPRLDLTAIPAGIYFVRILTADGVTTKRIIKN